MSRPVADLAPAARALMNSVAEARAVAAAGGGVQLGPLTRRLEQLLDRLALLPDAARKAQLPVLLALLEEVEALGAVLDQAHAETGRALGRSRANAQATAAYARRAGH